MKNAEILINSLSQWASPVIEQAVSNSGNMVLQATQKLISSDWLVKSVMNDLGMPIIKQYIERLPDEQIPKFSLNIIDGMIDHRVKNGGLEIPVLGVRLSPDAFRELKDICESNFRQYGEVSEKSEVKKDVQQAPSATPAVHSPIPMPINPASAV
jgi:hypothetical protein